MISIKICGITRVEDAIVASESGADAIGLNFFPKSKRFVTPEVAKQIASELHDTSLRRVGVFVNSPIPEVNQVAELVGLDWVQLHGDEPPESLTRIAENLKTIRVYRVGSEGLETVIADLALCKQAGRLPDMILLDAAVPGEYGGTGTRLSTKLLASYDPSKGSRSRSPSKHFITIPQILAGGLTPTNVAEAIEQYRPAGVDVASGVESEPGIKDPELVRQFVDNARTALHQA